MTVRIVPFEPRHSPAIAALNSRLAAGGVTYRFPEDYGQVRVAPGPDRPIYQRLYVAEDGASVRGGYIAKRQAFSANGIRGALVNYQLPLSEGLVDNRYRMVGVQLLKHALRVEPVMYALGMGGTDLPLPRMLNAAGWRVELVPFFFRVLNPQRFLATGALFRGHDRVAVTARIARRAGLGFVGLKTFQFATDVRRRHLVPRSASTLTLVHGFRDWADDVWSESHAAYGFVCERTAAVLQLLYPERDARFIRLQVSRQGRPIGWCVVMTTQMANHKQFGDLRVGSVIDGMCAPADVPTVLARATQFLERRGVDIIVSNQAHADWQRGLEFSGFLRGPSNYAFAVSPALAREIGTTAACHVTRGDGGGPIHL